MAKREAVSLRNGLALIRAFLLASTSLTFAGHALAQSAAQTDPNAAQELDEIVVVGTQIKGARVNDLLPVTVLDTRAIETTGAISGDELFRSIPQAGAVNFQDNKTSGGINDARGDVASINLRDLGTGNTLLLINGRRMVNNPGFQTELLVPVISPNTNTIPAGSVLRVEVLRDGASAIYGADAVGGVVNTVLRDNRTGGFLTSRYGVAEETSQYQFDLSGGYGFDFNGGQTNLTVYSDYFNTNAVPASGRDFSASDDLRPFVIGTGFEGDTNFDGRSTSAPWGVFRAPFRVTELADDDFHVQPTTFAGCRLELGNGLCADDGTTLDRDLRYDQAADRFLFSERERFNATALFSHNFSDSLELYSELSYYWFTSYREREMGRILAGQEIGITPNAYYNPLGPTLRPDGSVNTSRVPGLRNTPIAGTTLQLAGYRVGDAGPRETTVSGATYRILTGLRGEISSWDFDTALLYSRADNDDITTGWISLTALQNAINRTTPDAYNPFNGGGFDNLNAGDGTPSSQSAIDSLKVDVSRRGYTDLALADFKLSRSDLISLPGGDVGVALGLEFRRESFLDDRDPRLDGTTQFTNAVTGAVYNGDILSNSPTPDTSGSRWVHSTWAEAFVPIVSPDMNVPLIETLDVQLAARYEDFSDSGSTLVPRVAASWTLFPGVMVRGAWSEGFRAPNLVQVNDVGVQRVNTRDDYVICQARVRRGLLSSLANCPGNATTDRRSGSQSLKPEKTENINLGLVLSPAFIPNLTITADYWQIKQTGIVGVFGTQNHIALDLLLRQQGRSNTAVVRETPDADDIALFTGSGLAPAGNIIYVADTYFNLDNRESEGFDFGLYYEIRDTAIGDFRIGFNAARLESFFQTPSADGQQLLDAVASGQLPPEIVLENLGELLELGGRPKWQFSSSLNWEMGDFAVDLFGRYTGPFHDTGVVNDLNGSFWEVDPVFITNLTLSYTFNGNSALDGTRLQFGVRNLFNEDPPLSSESFGFFGEYHSGQGRFFSLGARKAF